MNPHRALIVVTLAEAGGAQTFCADLADGLRASWDVVVAAHGAEGPLVERCETFGVPYHHVRHMRRALSPAHDAAAVLELRSLVRRVEPDVVHVNSSKAGALVRIALAGTGIPVVFTAHGWAFSGRGRAESRAWSSIERSVAPLASAIVCVSDYDRQLGLGVGIPADKLRVIRNGVDPVPARRRKWPDAPTALCVARLSPQKDVGALLAAVDRDDLRNWSVIVAGDGPLRPDLEGEIRRRGLSDRVQLLGHRDDVPELMERADVFVLPSNWEGLPFSILEAMAQGLPVVATAVGGVPELVTDGETGLLVPRGDTDALGNSLAGLAGDPERTLALGEAGRRRVVSEFTRSAMVERHERLLRALVDARAPAPRILTGTHQARTRAAGSRSEVSEDATGRPRILHISKRVPDRRASHAGGVISGFYFDAVTQWAACDLLALRTAADGDVDLPGAGTVELVASHVDEQDAASVRGLAARLRSYLELTALAFRRTRSGRYDLVVVEWSALGAIGALLRVVCRQCVILICHDLYYDRLRSDLTGSSMHHTAASLMIAVTRWFELVGVRAARGVICFDYRTEALIRHDGGLRDVVVLPPVYSVWDERPEADGSIVFWGNMARSVNWRSARWFAREVFPEVRASFPDARFLIVGADPPAELTHGMPDGVTVTGFVEQPGEIVARAQVMVAPLVSGAGIKIKVLEGLAAGVPLVANTIAMQGIPAVPGVHYLHGETQGDFREHVLRLLTSSDLRGELAAKGRALAEESFDQEGAVQRQESFYRSILAKRHSETGLCGAG